MKRSSPLVAQHAAGGYFSQKRNRKPEELTIPSQNVRFTEEGEAMTRRGYFNTGIDLDEIGKEFDSIHHERLDATFFASDTVKYYDWTTETVFDTGVTGTVPYKCIEEYRSDIFVINATDGLQHIVVTKLTADTSSGTGAVFIEIDAAARLSAFAYTAKTLRIGETDYPYTAVNVSTGEVTLTGTLSSDVTAGTICTVAVDRSADVPNGTKIAFWKDCMHVIGVEQGNSDVPRYTLYYSEFSTAITAENIFSFSATQTELVGSGVLTNILPTKNYLYLFTSKETYYISVADVNIATGSRPPQIFSRLYGSANSKTVVAMDDEVIFLTQNNRIISNQIRLEDGSTGIGANANFDRAIKEHLLLADRLQASALMYYLPESKELHLKMNFNGETKELVFDNNLRRWCPPDTNKYFFSIFQRGNRSYATTEDDDTIYLLDEDYSDDGAEIESIIAFGEFDGEDKRATYILKEIEVSGSMIYGTNIRYTPRMNYNYGTEHTISYTTSTPVESNEVGRFNLGLTVVGGYDTLEVERAFDESLGNYPRKVRSFQPIFQSVGEDTGFSIKSWSVPRYEISKFITTRR